MSCLLVSYPVGIISLMQQLVSKWFLHFSCGIAFSFQCHWFSNNLGEFVLENETQIQSEIVSIFCIYNNDSKDLNTAL